MKKFKAPQIPNDLNVGYENYIVEDPSDTSTLEPLLDALAENNIDLSGSIVTYRNNLNKIFSSPYDEKNWEVDVKREKDVLYLGVRHLEGPPQNEGHKKAMYWGRRFEEICVEDNSVQFCSVVKTRLNTHKIIMGAEIDCYETRTKPPSSSSSTAKRKFNTLEIPRMVEGKWTHPKFLHSNSTSHVWAFSAIAELIDNSCDPDVQAQEFHIDVEQERGDYRLILADDGFGMTPAKLHKMLSFGYCEKVEVNGVKPIGHYGNGFKSGSMRLGKDALVFTKDKNGLCCGFLSQTFLEGVKADTVLVPMVTWSLKKEIIQDEESTQSLSAILKYSPYNTLNDLVAQFDRIKKTGTVIVISNMRKEGDNVEFDFVENPADIRIRSDQQVVGGAAGRKFQRHRVNQDANIDIPLDYSLRAYCEVLYLRPRMKIYIRGIKVRTKLIARSLSHTKIDTYKPSSWPQPVKITYGINAENKYVYGMMLYHRNRLIKPYVRVGIQLQHGKEGLGVIGIIEADFLQPTHNKQDFDSTPPYRNLMLKLAEQLNMYWQSIKNPKAVPKPVQPAANANATTAQQAVSEKPVGEYEYLEAQQAPDETWAQCDGCLKWRKLPSHVKPESLPDKWYCKDNIYDPTRSDCTTAQEDDSQNATPADKDLASFRKQIKEKEKAEAKKQKEVQSKRLLEEAAMEAARKEKEQRAKNEALLAQARASQQLAAQREAQERQERELAEQRAAIIAKERALAERERQMQEDAQRKAAEVQRISEEARRRAEEDTRRHAEERRRAADEMRKRIEEDRRIGEEAKRKAQEDSKKKEAELEKWFENEEKMKKTTIVNKRIVGKEEPPRSPKKVKTNPEEEITINWDDDDTSQSVSSPPHVIETPPCSPPIVIHDEGSQDAVMHDATPPPVSAKPHSTPAAAPAPSPVKVVPTPSTTALPTTPARVSPPRDTPALSATPKQLLSPTPAVPSSAMPPSPSPQKPIFVPPVSFSQPTSAAQALSTADKLVQISKSMSTLVKNLGSDDFLLSLGPDAELLLDRADPTLLASIDANALVNNVQKRKLAEDRKPDPIFVQAHRELVDLRQWIKKLLGILARKSDMNLNLEGGELDAYFVEWVKRQEAKRKGSE